MNEDNIAASLLPTPVKEPDIVPEPPKPALDEQSSYDYGINELTLYKMGSLLGIDRPEGKVQDYLKYIYEELMPQTQGNMDDTLELLKNYTIKLGISFEPDRLLKLYNWMRLNNERILIEKEMAKYGS